MSDKVHGHAPRIRRKYNQESEEETVIEVNKNKIISNVISSAIGGVIGYVVTNSLKEE